MGHISAKDAYGRLQQRLDRMPIGAPAHRALFELLEELLTAEEAHVAACIPLRLARLGQIARAADRTEQHTAAVLDRLADKGVVVDLPREGRSTLYYLNPTVIGFFEFTMMRVREDLDQRKVAQLMWEYLAEDPNKAFVRRLTDGETFIARPLVHDNALTSGQFAEVLEHDRAAAIVKSAGAWAEGLCHCRHVKLHKDQPCRHPLGHCLSLGNAARYLTRRNLAEPVDEKRAQEILAYSQEHGLVYMADNVRHQPAFICNCCKCCCEMMEGLRQLPQNTVVTSGYSARSEARECTGCAKCAKACPVEAIQMMSAEPSAAAPKRKKRAEVDEQVCIGCGVCVTRCKSNAMLMQRSSRRVQTPENMMERVTLQAIERGTLQYLLFNDTSKLTHRALAAFLGVILSLPPAKQALAVSQLKSRFVQVLLGRKVQPDAH